MKEGDNAENVLKLSEAARFVRVSEKTLAEMARRGDVPGKKVGREWRFLREALEEWLRGEWPTPGRRQPAEGGEPPAGRGTSTRVAEPVAQYQKRFIGFRDTAFAENYSRAMHRWVPWIAGFSASFVEHVLKEEARDRPRRMTVLDPFAGVGTTLVEAFKLGHDTIGFEINPYAALACRAKMGALSYDVALLRRVMVSFAEYMERMDGLRDDGAPVPASSPPAGFVSRSPFFSPDVERQVLHVLDFIRAEREPWLRDLLRLAFGSVMVGFSNYTYEPSLGTRSAAGKPDIENAEVARVVSEKLREMAEDISLMQELARTFDTIPQARVIEGSFFDHADAIPRRSVDVLVTSPPYLNNYHYIRNTRPQMFWLGMVEKPSDLKAMEHNSFGRFWQTVRSGPAVALEPRIPGLVELIEELRHRNEEKGPYGGPGWANYAASYFNDCARFCRLARDVMKPGGKAVVVIGNNILQGIEFPTDRFFADIARRCGFEIVGLHEVRKKRTGSSIVNSAVRAGTVKKRVKLYETAVEMRAPTSSLR